MRKILDVFAVFLKLGLTSFGGPIAHLGYFRREFVERRRWFDDATYSEFVALAQFLPGPSSSQVGMLIGLLRAGFGGMMAAWVAFTLPSALLLVGFAMFQTFVEAKTAQGVTHGLMIVAVAVVAQAVVQMSRTLTPDWRRRLVALAAFATLLMLPFAVMQIGVLVAGGIFGYLVLTPPEDAVAHRSFAVPYGMKTGAALIAGFFSLLFVLPLLALHGGEAAKLADIFYRSGALVFGGGHVVLPILETALVPSGFIARDTFFAGYGAAQAMPGPLFSFAAYIGSAMQGGNIAYAALCLAAMFAPSFLLVPGVLPFWARLSLRKNVRSGLMGVNAAVVGMLAAAFVSPIFATAIMSVFDLAVAIAAFAALQWSGLPVWLVVLCTGALGLFLV